MSIIAYASANADPINNPLVDGEIDLASVATPASITLYGDAVDTEDGSASFSFAWTLLDPTDSGAVLSSTTTQNITITNITAWHNLRLHLVATNTATSATSETDVLLAPSASFVEVRVLSENRGIQKIAKGSRSWHPALAEWADAIETAPNLNELSDVTNATGAELDILRGGALAESGGSALHTHAGAHISNATTTTAGVVQLEEASDATGTPRVITQERIVLTGHTTSSTESDGTRHNEIVKISGAGEVIPHVYHVISRHDITIHAYTVAMTESGPTTDNYKFNLMRGTSAEFAASTMSTQLDTVTINASAAHAPILVTRTLSPAVTVSAGDVIGLQISASPTAGSGGGSLSVTIEATRSVT